MMHFYYGHFWWGPIFMVLFWVFLIWFGVWFLRSIFQERSYPGHHGWGRWKEMAGPGANEILDQRYARGEISRDEYITMKNDLNANPAPDLNSNPDDPD